jgi:hypothetical protein
VKFRSLQLAMNAAKMGGTYKRTPDLDRKNYFIWFVGRWRLCRIGGCLGMCQKFERIPSFCITDGNLKHLYLSFNLHNVTPQLTVIFKFTKWGLELSYAIYIYIYIYISVLTCAHSRTLAKWKICVVRSTLFSSVKRSESNFCGSGKYVGSWCRTNTGV